MILINKVDDSWHDERIWMDEDLDGEGPQRVEWTEQVTRRLRVKPVDDVSFTEHDEGLQRDR